MLTANGSTAAPESGETPARNAALGSVQKLCIMGVPGTKGVCGGKLSFSEMGNIGVGEGSGSKAESANSCSSSLAGSPRCLRSALSSWYIVLTSLPVVSGRQWGQIVSGLETHPHVQTRPQAAQTYTGSDPGLNNPFKPPVMRSCENRQSLMKSLKLLGCRKP